MKVKSSLYALLIFFCLISCKKESSVKDDSSLKYKYFHLEKSGWKSIQSFQKVNSIIYTATEVPLPYYVLKDMGTENLFNVDSVCQANKRERIIEFEFMQDEEKDLLESNFTGLEYKKSIQYISFAIQKDFYVVTSKKDTIKCEGVNFERNYKIAPYQKMLLFFTNIDPDDKIQLVYQDHLFSNGTLKFTFKEKISTFLL